MYTAKHNCGFLAWNSSGQGLPVPYPYSTAHAPNGGGIDPGAEFVAAARRRGVGVGFYYRFRV